MGRTLVWGEQVMLYGWIEEDIKAGVFVQNFVCSTYN